MSHRRFATTVILYKSPVWQSSRGNSQCINLLVRHYRPQHYPNIILHVRYMYTYICHDYWNLYITTQTYTDVETLRGWRYKSTVTMVTGLCYKSSLLALRCFSVPLELCAIDVPANSERLRKSSSSQSASPNTRSTYSSSSSSVSRGGSETPALLIAWFIHLMYFFSCGCRKYRGIASRLSDIHVLYHVYAYM